MAKKKSATRRKRPAFVETPAPLPAGSPQEPPQATEIPNAEPVTIARLVAIIPSNRKDPGYHELDVRAVQRGDFAGRSRAPGDVFRVGVIGEGELPAWVRRA
jgi:hypothetical protein